MPARLASQCIFRSPDLDETQSFVGRLFSPHRQRAVAPGNADTRVHKVRIGGASLIHLQYGIPVILDEGQLDCVVVKMLTHGSVKTRCGDQYAESTPERFTVLSPDQPIRMHWSAGTKHFALRLSQDRVERFVEAAIGHPLEESIRFDLGMQVERPLAAGWLRLMQYVMDECDRPESPIFQPVSAAQLESTIIATLLSVQPHNYQEEMLRPASDASPKYLRRAEDFIRARAQDPISLVDIVDACGVGGRTLSWSFRRYRGTTPLGYLRTIRLDRVHRELLDASPGSTSVTEVALRWGFTHLGRFASDYAARFHEKPSETLRR
jgi:AraC-like DNA-binding protein